MGYVARAKSDWLRGSKQRDSETSGSTWSPTCHMVCNIQNIAKESTIAQMYKGLWIVLDLDISSYGYAILGIIKGWFVRKWGNNVASKKASQSQSKTHHAAGKIENVGTPDGSGRWEGVPEWSIWAQPCGPPYTPPASRCAVCWPLAPKISPWGRGCTVLVSVPQWRAKANTALPRCSETGLPPSRKSAWPCSRCSVGATPRCGRVVPGAHAGWPGP